MTMPLLTTRLHIPPSLPEPVSRPRPAERLTGTPHLRRQLTTIYALADLGITLLDHQMDETYSIYNASPLCLTGERGCPSGRFGR